RRNRNRVMILRPEHAAKRAHGLVHQLDEVRIEMADGIGTHRFEYTRIGVARTWPHEQTLRGVERRRRGDACGGRFGGRGHASPNFCASPMRCSLPVAPTGISVRMRIFRGTL